MPRTYDIEDPFERLAMRVSEHVTQYLLVARIGDSTRVLMSDASWGEAVIPTIEAEVEDRLRKKAAAPAPAPAAPPPPQEPRESSE